MFKLDDKSIDMILCDLPYGVTRNRWDSVISLDKLWEQYERIIQDKGAIILFGQGVFTAKLILSNEQMFRYNYVWDKVNKHSGFLNAKYKPLRRHEMISIFYKNKPIYNIQWIDIKPYTARSSSDITNDNYREHKNYNSKKINIIRNKTSQKGKGYPISILKFKGQETSNYQLHPTQKPVALCEYLIKTYTRKNQLVLDNCIGSGTTAIACMNVGRNFVGIEKEAKYVKIARDRIRRHKKTV